MAVIVTLGGDGLVVSGEASELLEKLRGADGYLELDTQDGTVHLNPASVAYVKDGDVVDPVRDTPGVTD
jgi:hypothetical protein